jgi:hypothetical protein
VGVRQNDANPNGVEQSLTPGIHPAKLERPSIKNRLSSSNRGTVLAVRILSAPQKSPDVETR